MIYRLITQYRQKACVTQLCRVFQVSRSGYYGHIERQRRQRRVCALEVHVQAIFAASGRCYGSRRLQAGLHQRGILIGRHRVRTLMRRYRLRPSWRGRFIHTTQSNHALPVSENLLARRFNPPAPDTAWVCDITYIRTGSGWLYLAAVMDLFSRKIVGWAMAPKMPAELVCTALQMAIAQRQPAAGLIVHSDRGSQYASEAFQDLLAHHSYLGSMSGKGNCWDNAVMERFFLNLKIERVWQRQYANHAEAMADVTDYIVGFYNGIRLHSTLGYLPPIAFERKQAAKKPINVSEIS